MLSLRTHGFLDYVLGALLLVCPFLFDFTGLLAARNLFFTLGLGLIGYSLVTRYPFSILKMLPLGWHMSFDVLIGLTLLIGPNLMGYRDEITGAQVALHYLLGLGAIALVMATRPRTDQGLRDLDRDQVPLVDDRAA